MSGNNSDILQYKEEYRLFYMVKGHLDATPETVLASANGYFKRLWYDGSNGAPLYDYAEQFEQAWEQLQHGEQKDTETESK